MSLKTRGALVVNPLDKAVVRISNALFETMKLAAAARTATAIKAPLNRAVIPRENPRAARLTPFSQRRHKEDKGCGDGSILCRATYV